MKKLVNLGSLAASAAVMGMALIMQAAPTKKTKMDPVQISCGTANEVSIEINVCAPAGGTGAPAGFSIQWITADALALGPDGIAGTLDDNTWPLSDATPGVDAGEICKASFSGNANGTSYNLAPGQCVTVKIGDNLFDNPGASSTCASTPLDCDTRYVFRAFTHANSSLQRSDFTANLSCQTEECGGNPNCIGECGGCTYTQGYWKTHTPLVCETDLTSPLCIEWPVETLNLGSVSYDVAQLVSILNTPSGGNGLIALAHQLIAAKLNFLSGGFDTGVQPYIDAADALIAANIVPPVGAGSLSPAATSALIAILTQFNEGVIGPGHCE
jgi:hypothetical protein